MDQLNLDFLDQIVGKPTNNTFEEFVHGQIDLNEYIKFNKIIEYKYSIPQPEITVKSADIIAAHRGDDGAIITNRPEVGISHLYTGENIIGIQLSQHDVGFSQHICNYAEGWILLPVTAGTTFRGTTMYNRTQGVPILLDTVKCKLLSPVRKQSDKETDLPSKYNQLYTAAHWVDPDWFTHDFHQLALLIATQTLDFTTSIASPILYKSEGGCGGAPPWRNIMTGYFYNYHFNRGRAKDAHAMIMAETNAVMQGFKKPQDCHVLHATRLIQADPNQFEKLESTLQGTNLSGVEISKLLDSIGGDPLPLDLDLKSIEIFPADQAIGVAISKLRNEGLVMTELDVKIMFESEKKQNSITGNIPIPTIEIEEEARKRKIRQRGFKTICAIATGLRYHIPETTWETYRERSIKYYQYGEQYYDHLTSLAYNGYIKVIKTLDVKNYFSNTSKRDFLADILHITRTTQGPLHRPIYTIQESLDQERVYKWLEGIKTTKDLKDNPLPVGLASDDSRLFHQMELHLKTTSHCDSRILLIITDDKKLVREIAGFYRPALKEKGIRLYRMSPITLFIITERGMKIGRSDRIKLINPRLGVCVRLNATDHQRLLEAFDFDGISCELEVLYDVPNIERTIPAAHYDRSNRQYEIQGRKHLSRQTLREKANEINILTRDIKSISTELIKSKSTRFVSDNLHQYIEFIT